MGVSSWMVRRSRGRGGGDEDVQLDPKKGTVDNLREVLNNVCRRQGISEEKRLNYLNSFLKIISGENKELGITKEDVFYCLRPLLVHESVRIRATALNIVRHLLCSKQDFASCIKLQYPCLLARSLDLMLRNDAERVQAICVARRLLCINALEFPMALARSLVALAMSTIDEKDRLLRASLATLAELCLLNPDVFILCGGVTALVRNLGTVASPRMVEAIIGSLLFLINKPETRMKAMINLECLAAPYTDPHTLDSKMKDGVDSTEYRLQWAHVVLVSLLRSWPGLLHFCHPEKEGLQSIVATLYLNQREIRRAVLDLLYDLLCLAQPEWSDEICVALDAVDPSRFQEAFRLSDGFMAAEGKAVLPHISRSRVNLAEVHLSLLLYSFLEAGLLDAIVEVIVSDDTFLSVRATILLGELLHLIHLLLPPECCHVTPVLPNLLSYAVRGRPASRLHRPPFTAHIGTTTAHYESFKKDMIQRDRARKKESVSSTGKPERTRTVSSQSCRSRTVSDSSGERSRLDRDSTSAQGDPPPLGCSELRDAGVDPKITPRTMNALRDVLKDIAESHSDANSADEMGNITEREESVQEQPKDGQRSKLQLGENPFADDLEQYFDPQTFPIPEPPSPLMDNEIYDAHPVYKDPPFCSRAQQRALTAVSTLARLHRLLRKRPAPASIYLDHLITSIDRKEAPSCHDLARAKGRSLNKNKLSQVLNKECDDVIKESGVLSVKDPFAWNWDAIRSILKSKAECFYDSSQRQFLRKLVQFLLPSSRQLTRVDIGPDRKAANSFTLTAFELIDCLLLSPEESDCEKLLIELLSAITAEVAALNAAKSAHDCLLSPHNVMNTLCADYFLYAGHLSRTLAGRRLLDRVGLFQQMHDLVVSTNHECYVKLIVSTLDYTVEGYARKIMNKTVLLETIPFRLYATKLLHVILRTPMQMHRSMVEWVIGLLVNQLFDKDKAVVNMALEALDEACDCKEYLEVVVKLRPSLDHLGDLGLLLRVRFLSLPDGYVYLFEEGFVNEQLPYWATHFNFQYVCLVEGQLCDSLTLHERGEDGSYCARISGNKHSPSDIFVPPHLYGQLAQHEAGFRLLMADENVKKLVTVAIMSYCRTDEEILQLKAALWALGHITSSPEGARWARENRVTNAMLNTVRFCPVYSVRATAFYALNITATTTEGATSLRAAGWHTVRHHRHERWPVLVSLDLLEDVVLVTDDDQEDSVSSSDIDQIGRNGVFYMPKESSISESDNDDYLNHLPSCSRVGKESRSATLPHYSSGSVAGGPPVSAAYHHNRSHSESKADSEQINSPRHSSGDCFEPRINMSIEGLKKNRPGSSVGSTGSSNESVQYGRYSVSDRVQTLSPIPSSGSLSMIKYAGGGTGSGANPQLRRTSITASNASHNSTRLSHQDAVGYATLRFLHRGRRPLPTPMPALSPLSPIELIAFQDLKQISPLVRPRHLAAQPVMSEFEVQGMKCRLLSDVTTPAALPYQSSRSCIARSSDSSSGETAWSGPCYLGICLPQRLAELFPEDDEPHMKVVSKDMDNAQEVNLGLDNSSGESETDTGTDTGTGGGVMGGGGYGVPQKEVPSRRRHDRNSCLLCTSNRAANQRVARLRKISTSSTHRIRTETESSYGAGGEGESPIMLPWQTRGGLEGVNSVDSSSTDVTSVVAQRSLVENVKSRSMVRRDILKLADQLSNPVLYKTCKQALLHLKQMYSDLFQDICVYSDICAIIANNSHRLQSRRFLQELFLDIPFTELYEDSIALLSGGENGGDDFDQAVQMQDHFAQQTDEVGLNNEAGVVQNNNSNRGKAGKSFAAFEADQRNNPLLEVIPEHDARSDSSDACRESIQSLDLSDFSAPNSFDGDISIKDLDNGKLESGSFNLSSLQQHEILTLANASAQLSCSTGLQQVECNRSEESGTVSDRRTANMTVNGNVIPRTLGRELSKEKQKEAEKAKQMIEKSSSKISVLQESLKLNSSPSTGDTKSPLSLKNNAGSVNKVAHARSSSGSSKVERQGSSESTTSSKPTTPVTRKDPSTRSVVPDNETSPALKATGASHKTTAAQPVTTTKEETTTSKHEKRSYFVNKTNRLSGSNKHLKSVSGSGGSSPKSQQAALKKSYDDLSSGSSSELKSSPIQGQADGKNVTTRQRKKATSKEPNRDSLEVAKSKN